MPFLVAAAPALALAGAVVGAVGTIYAGQAQKQALDYQAQVARNNAIIAEQNAKYAIESGESKAAAESLKEAEVGGEIKAAQAAGGVDVNTGSNKAVQISQREIGKLNTQQVLANQQLVAYGYRSQATGFQAQSQLDTMEGSQAAIGADIGAAGQILGAAGKWYAPSPTAFSGVSDTYNPAAGTGIG